MIQQDKYRIIINEVVWYEVSDKVDVQVVTERLCNINLSSYGSGIERVDFTFVVVKPTNKLHDNLVTYNTHSKVLILELKLSYEHVLNATKRDVNKMMEELFLVSIDLYEGAGVKGFDIVRFKQDCIIAFSDKSLKS